MKAVKNLFLILILCLNASLAQTQTKKDSLLKLLKNSTENTSAIIYNQLSDYYIEIDSNDLAIKYASLALKYSGKEGNKTNLINSEINIATAYSYKGEPDSSIKTFYTALKLAVEGDVNIEVPNIHKGIADNFLVEGIYDSAGVHYHKSLNKFIELNDKGMQAIVYNGIGSVYAGQSNFSKAIDYKLKALNLKEKLFHEKNKKIKEISIVKSYYDIALTYTLMKKNSLAIEYLNKCIRFYKKANDQSFNYEIYNLLGNIYYNTNKPDSSELFFRKSLYFAILTDSPSDQAATYSNISNIFSDKKQYDSCLYYINKAYSIYKVSPDRVEGQLNCLLNYINLYKNIKQYNQSLSYCKKAMNLSIELGIIEDIRDCYLGYYNAYKSLKKSDSALANYEKYIKYRDSSNNRDISISVAKSEMNYEFEKKEMMAQMEQEKKDELAREKESTVRVVIIIISIGLIISLILALWAFKSNLQKQKAFKIITLQKQLVEEQKQKVEEHQKEILDSIRYARRIQQALLPNEKYIIKSVNKFKYDK